MPVTLPPATVSQELSADDYRLPSGMIERERAFWLIPVRSALREPAPCPEAKGSEIVVCALREDDPARDRLGAPVPDAPTLAEELQRKTTVSLGPAQAHLASGRGAEGEPTIGLTVGIKF